MASAEQANRQRANLCVGLNHCPNARRTVLGLYRERLRANGHTDQLMARYLWHGEFPNRSHRLAPSVFIGHRLRRIPPVLAAALADPRRTRLCAPPKIRDSTRPIRAWRDGIRGSL